MAILLITYKLTHAEIDNSGLVESIQEFSHVRLADTSWLIETKISPEHVYEELRTFLYSNDSLYVFELKKNWKGRGENKVVDWAAKRL